MGKAESALNCKGQNSQTEFVELFRRQNPNGTVERYHKAIEAIETKRQRAPKDNSLWSDDDEGNADEPDAPKLEIARCRRLLKSVALIVANSQVDTSIRQPGCLQLAADVFAKIAKLEAREPYVDEPHRWVRKHLRGVSRAAIEAAAASARPKRPGPRAAGRALALTRAEWFALNKPWGIHPVDLTPAEVRKQQRKEADLVHNARRKMNRKHQGASITSLAHEHG